MSGTSGDGLDIACCEFTIKKNWRFKIIKAETIPFTKELEQSLQNAHLLDAESLECLDLEFGEWMGKVTKDFCLKNNLKPTAIASHGHTVFHRPDLKMTKQIGNGFALSHTAGLPVINDFRKLDVVMGGQGAPLVPIGDALLFSDFDFALNLGGIANISMDNHGERIAFDTCPFNLLFNHFALKSGKAYDEGGNLARSGSIIPEALTALNSLGFYQQKGAKSLGRENISQDFFPVLNHDTYSPNDVLTTLSEHYAACIARIILDHAKEKSTKSQLLVTGGGAYNTFFIQNLQNKISHKVNLVLPEKQIIDFKEALVFAFLGVLRLRKENNCLASVTGATEDNCGGTIFGLFNEI
ncbi:Anhydro-N-acetylmuramic acid kinase [Cyclobacterium qasimii M12-11B]|uniref:Anhydro-N-acetylmuramic acid kinase n=3 Tax=Cyclobacterium qasimii TaxID=1350429 RepID=S7V7Z2_9BACT|nr:Anhydro-N-acetylmuramic acid kinase [Cyclobacterium qasimii M12-11B]GEO23865.1 anhydro-N-acetylmuramic acid kinase [Cyclobacterium qasimii]